MLNNTKLTVSLYSLEDSFNLSRAIYEFSNFISLKTLLLFGGLGVGKTTFVKSLVNSLPGSENCDVNSPSFTTANIYPTTPKVYHFDLYRLGNNASCDMLEDALDDNNSITIIEWSENLPSYISIEDGLALFFSFTLEEEKRICTLQALGSNGALFLDNLSHHKLSFTNKEY